MERIMQGLHIERNKFMIWNPMRGQNSRLKKRVLGLFSPQNLIFFQTNELHFKRMKYQYLDKH